MRKIILITLALGLSAHTFAASKKAYCGPVTGIFSQTRYVDEKPKTDYLSAEIGDKTVLLDTKELVELVYQAKANKYELCFYWAEGTKILKIR